MFLGFSGAAPFFFPRPAVVSQFTSLVFHLENKLKIKFDNYLIKLDVESQFFCRHSRAESSWNLLFGFGYI